MVFLLMGGASSVSISPAKLGNSYTEPEGNSVLSVLHNNIDTKEVNAKSLKPEEMISMYGKLYRFHHSTGSLEDIGYNPEQTVYVSNRDDGEAPERKLTRATISRRISMISTDSRNKRILPLRNEFFESEKSEIFYDAEISPKHPKALIKTLQKLGTDYKESISDIASVRGDPNWLSQYSVAIGPIIESQHGSIHDYNSIGDRIQRSISCSHHSGSNLKTNQKLIRRTTEK